MENTLPDVPLSVVDKLYGSGAFFCIGILAVFFVARYLTKHWSFLASGSRHVWATALVGGLAALVVPATQGTTPNATMLTMVVITIIGISADPKKIAAITGALALAFVLHTSSGCGGSSRQTTISYTVQGLTAAGAALQAYGPAHEIQVAQTAANRAEAEEKVAYWKATRTKLEFALEGCLRALSVADSDAKVTAAVQQAAAFYADLTKAGVIGGAP